MNPYELIQIEHFWIFVFYKKNPRIESLGNWICKYGFTSLPLLIRKTLIFKDLFCGLVLKICLICENRSNLQKFAGFMVKQFELNLLKSGFIL
jgi:hypothetical protein